MLVAMRDDEPPTEIPEHVFRESAEYRKMKGVLRTARLRSLSEMPGDLLLWIWGYRLHVVGVGIAVFVALGVWEYGWGFLFAFIGVVLIGLLLWVLRPFLV